MAYQRVHRFNNVDERLYWDQFYYVYIYVEEERKCTESPRDLQKSNMLVAVFLLHCN